jgi:putative RecB family exonuclease
VDVLADDPQWLPGMGAEIWDYKGGRKPKNQEDFIRYEFQMLVYTELYHERNGVYPTKAILYFLGELDDAKDTLQRPSTALVEVAIAPKRREIALQNFDKTVADIEECRTNDRWSAPPIGQEPDQETCDICDLRWNCSSVGQGYPMRFP